MHPTVLYNHVKNWEDPKSCFSARAIIVQLFNTLITYNPGLRSLQKNHLAQTKHPIVLYIHAKIGIILRAVLKKKPKKSKTPFLDT